MSTIQVIAIEPFDGNQPGATVTVSERQAEQLVVKGLAKVKGPHSTKVKPPLANKANPSKAAGQGRTSSASPAARPSAKKTVVTLGDGAKTETTDE